METVRNTGYRDELARLTPGLRRFARALVRNHQTETADDLVQATLRRALDGDQARRAGRLQIWLVSILVGLHREQVRHLGVEQKLGFAAGDPVVTGGGSPWRSARRDTALIGGVPLDYREPLLLVALEGMTYSQVAECLGVSVATVSTRVARGRDHLARAQAIAASETVPAGATSRGVRAPAPHLRVVK